MDLCDVVGGGSLFLVMNILLCGGILSVREIVWIRIGDVSVFYFLYFVYCYCVIVFKLEYMRKIYLLMDIWNWKMVWYIENSMIFGLGKILNFYYINLLLLNFLVVG